MASPAKSEVSLSNEEIGRYSRQMILPELGMNGQQHLKNGSILVVGMGGLGSPASMFLAAAGVGNYYNVIVIGEFTVESK